jgi:hypothetical protein
VWAEPGVTESKRWALWGDIIINSGLVSTQSNADLFTVLRSSFHSSALGSVPGNSSGPKMLFLWANHQSTVVIIITG